MALVDGEASRQGVSDVLLEAGVVAVLARDQDVGSKTRRHLGTLALLS